MVASKLELEPLLEVADVAALFRETKPVVRERARRGEIPALRLSPRGRWKFRRHDIETLIGASEPPPPRERAAPDDPAVDAAREEVA